jgi:hypothetical protein
MKNSCYYLICAILGFAAIVSGCTKDFYVIPEVEITGPVSFTDDVLPIFNNSCNSDGCHNTGGIPPDLSPANAFTNLFLYNVVDTLNPEMSSLYLAMNTASDPMPPSGLLDPVEIATVLAWIKQGAINN